MAVFDKALLLEVNVIDGDLRDLLHTATIRHIFILHHHASFPMADPVSTS
jgi:hypothetical protein